MTAMQRRKGQSGERELANLVTDLTGFACRRLVRQHEKDSDVDGVPGWSIEVKRWRRITPAAVRAAWEQAEEQAGELIPVLFIRPDRGSWIARWPLSLLLVGRRTTWRGYEWTCETSVEAWASVVMETLPNAIGMTTPANIDVLLSKTSVA
jgi:hypothetical protein